MGEVLDHIEYLDDPCDCGAIRGPFGGFVSHEYGAAGCEGEQQKNIAHLMSCRKAGCTICDPA